jgi:dienelactone hydrolase
MATGCQEVTRGNLTFLFGLLAFFCGCWMPAAASDLPYLGPRLIEEQVRIPVEGAGRTIAATIIRPDGPGPYGAVILNHGVPGSEEERVATSAADFQSAAPIFARRGYGVVMPLRRGFGATGGAFAEDTGPCSNPHFVRGEQAASDDVMAAYEYARRLPQVDPSRMILAGQSAGGMVSMFTAGMRTPKGLLAVLSFAAGRGGNPASAGLPCAVEPLALVFDMLGKSVRVPVLFHYAENDRFFGPQVTRQWYQRFTAGGARAEYTLQPEFGDDGHFLFSELTGVRHWLPAVEKFLAVNGVPFDRLDKESANKHELFAAKPPYISSQACSGLYRVFLESPAPRAYAVSPDGHCGFAGGMERAQAEALKQCGKMAQAPCELYAEGEAVVWKGHEATTNFASSGEPRSAPRDVALTPVSQQR